MEETWRDIPGYEGKYQISIDTPEGRCRSLNWKNTGKIKILSNKPNKVSGYIFWHLQNNDKGYSWQAARWIALTYPELVEGEYFEGAQIDHKDTNRLNNHPSNLRWTDNFGNMRNPITREHMKDSATGIHLNRPDKSKWVIKLNTNNEILHFYPSIHQAERETGVNFRHISKVCLGQRKTAGGFVWKFAE